jgi:hypothetical protein
MLWRFLEGEFEEKKERDEHGKKKLCSMDGVS